MVSLIPLCDAQEGADFGKIVHIDLISKYVWVIETIYHRRKVSFRELLWVDGRDNVL